MTRRTKSNPEQESAAGPRRWPLVLAGLVYAGWVVFLLVMALLRVRETSRL
jgi:hypothetical protein